MKWRMGELPKLPQVLHASVECHPGRWAGKEGGGVVRHETPSGFWRQRGVGDDKQLDPLWPE